MAQFECVISCLDPEQHKETIYSTGKQVGNKRKYMESVKEVFKEDFLKEEAVAWILKAGNDTSQESCGKGLGKCRAGDEQRKFGTQRLEVSVGGRRRWARRERPGSKGTDARVKDLKCQGSERILLATGVTLL